MIVKVYLITGLDEGYSIDPVVVSEDLLDSYLQYEGDGCRFYSETTVAEARKWGHEVVYPLSTEDFETVDSLTVDGHTVEVDSGDLEALAKL
jgi:hypothetical protein